MANDQFVLSPATVDDVTGMADVYLTAFGSDAFSSFAFPRDKISDQEMRKWLTERFTKTITEKKEVRAFIHPFFNYLSRASSQSLECMSSVYETLSRNSTVQALGLHFFNCDF